MILVFTYLCLTQQPACILIGQTGRHVTIPVHQSESGISHSFLLTKTVIVAVRSTWNHPHVKQ